MAGSYIDPSLVALATEPAAPPWNWNPGETFVTAFNNAQENRRANEKAAQEAELNTILFPYKRAAAALELDKLQQDVERSTALTEKIRAANKVTHQNMMQGIQNPQSQQSSNPYDLFSDEVINPDTGEEEQSQPPPTMDLNGFTSMNDPVGGSENNPLYDMPEQTPDTVALDTSKIPTTGLLADSSSELTPTAMSAMHVASEAVSPQSNPKQTADEMLLARLRESSGSVDFDSLPSPERASTPRISIDDAPATKAEPKSSSGNLNWATLDPILSKRKLLKNQYDGIQSVKNYRLDGVKLDQTSKWNQASAKALQKLSAFGITDPVTLDALTDLPSESRQKAQRLVQESLANGNGPNWTSAIKQVSGDEPGKGTGSDRRTELAKTIREVSESEIPDKEAVLGSLVREFSTLTSQQPAYEAFTQSQSQLDMLPAYQAKGRPLNGRTDYDILSQELLDSKLQAAQGMIKNGDDRVLNMLRYAKTDAGKLTASGTDEYIKDLAAKREKYGNNFVIFTGQDAVLPTQGTTEVVGTQPGRKKTFDEYTQAEMDAMSPEDKENLLRERKESEARMGRVTLERSFPVADGSALPSMSALSKPLARGVKWVGRKLTEGTSKLPR
jgi:hypothetical protein